MLDRAESGADQDVALARAGWADEQQVLSGAHPLQRCNVIERRQRNRGGACVKYVQVFEHWQVGGFESQLLVGPIACADLSRDQRPQHLFDGPALCPSSLQDLWCVSADRGQFQASQSSDQVVWQWR